MHTKTSSKIVSALLVAAMLTSASLTTAAVDITGHWAEDSIAALAENGYITADETGNYHPGAPVSVKSFYAILGAIPGLEKAANITVTGISADSEEAITRETAFAILGYLLNVEETGTALLNVFRDGKEVAGYARKYIAGMVTAGYVTGRGDGTLAPKAPLTLADLAALVNRTQYTLSADEEGYVYGTARLTWEQFWANEGLSYDESIDFDASNETTDTEGMADLGGFDAVTRATSKHGIYRGAAHYSYILHAADEAGNPVDVYLEDMEDADVVEDMYGAGKNFYGVQANGSEVYYITQPESGAYTTYTITNFEVVGYKEWPVKVPASDVAAVAESINFKMDGTVTSETSRIKTIGISENGNITVSAAAESAGKTYAFDGKVNLTYDDKYGDYIFFELKNITDTEWGMNLLGVTYEFYGDVNPEETADAEPIAVYGTKYGADTWWKSNGKTLHLGINTSYRHGGNGEVGGTEQHGYWKIVIMSDGYEDTSVVVKTLPAYTSEVTAALAEDNKTLTISGISAEDLAKTTVTVDGTAVTLTDGTAVLEGLAIGAHTVSISIDGWREITDEIIVMSSLTMADITLTGNVLTINGGDVANYLNNVTGIAVNGTTLSGNDLGNVVFNADGSVNFAAEIAGKRSSTVVFPDGTGVSYMLIITSAGYPNVILNTEAAG